MIATHEQTRSIAKSILEMYGYNITNYDPAFLQRGLTRFGLEHQCHDYGSIRKLLLEDETLIREFLDKIFINVSEMFRDPDVFSILRSEIFPYISSYPVIKIWSAGCAHGQEAYSLAIILKELGIYDRSVLYATDIDPEAVEKAYEGRYPMKDALKYYENYYLSGGIQKFSEYFTIAGDYLVINDDLRQNICFSCHNIVTDAVFNEFSLILCRNMLIYFDSELQLRALKLFNNSLAKRGFLILGKSESLNTNGGYRYFDNHKLSDRIFKRQ